jgi:hypothetical protein
MNTQEHIDRISQARALLQPLITGSEEPQIEAILRSADMELHWALWNLGVVTDHRPEAGYGSAQA